MKIYVRKDRATRTRTVRGVGREPPWSEVRRRVTRLEDGTILEDVEVTHVHLNDGTCQGIEHAASGSFGVQYHPEASAGPHDSRYLFSRFIDRMKSAR